MKTLIIYSSQTGFTKRYAEWIGQKLDAELLTIKDAKKKNEDYFRGFDAILYGGWSMGGKLVNIEWFLEHAINWKEKKLAIFGVGATPADAPEISTFIESVLSDEQKKYISVFYCPGGLDYSRMNFFCRIMMKMFAKSMNKKEGLSDYEKQKAEALLTSFDISDRKYIEPIISFVNNQ